MESCVCVPAQTETLDAGRTRFTAKTDNKCVRQQVRWRLLSPEPFGLNIYSLLERGCVLSVTHYDGRPKCYNVASKVLVNWPAVITSEIRPTCVIICHTVSQTGFLNYTKKSNANY